MDDHYLDSKSSRRVWEDRPRGPFEVNEPLPKPVQLWKERTNLATNKKQELLHFGWQRNSAQRILESLELHSYEWTVRAIKTRECLDKQDRRDIAVSTFAMSRNKDLLLVALEIRDLDLTRPEDNTAELRLIAKANTRLLQIGAVDDLIADPDSPTEEPDRTALLSLCDMEPTELLIYRKLLEVYDRARSHFFFDIVELQVKRFLNAERLKAEAENPPRTLSYREYTALYLERTQNSELTQDLLSYILKPREEGCPIYLWAAERISESKLLTANGLAMSDQAWLAYTLAFITPDERQVLQVPSLAERAGYNHGNGYTLADLEAAISAMDVTTLKRFRQATCTDPVAVQILSLNRLKEKPVSSSSPAHPAKKNRFPPRGSSSVKESFSAEAPPKSANSSIESFAAVSKGNSRNTRPASDLSKLDSPANLPQKDGKVDMSQYAKYKTGGLRQKIHEAIRSKKCIRCWSADHLRSSCQEPPRSWEEDFNQGRASFWGPKPKQARPQWLSPPQLARDLIEPPSLMLFAYEGEMKIALDTGSEISIGRKDLLKNIRLVNEEVFVESLGGMRQIFLEGEISLAGKVEITVFAVEEKDLPPGTRVLLGNPHLKGMGVSLDFAQQHPYCQFSETLIAGIGESLPRPLQHEKQEFFFVWLSFGLASFALNMVILTSALFGFPLLSLIEPRALFELIVCLFACRFAWICPEMLLSSLASTVRPPARASEPTTSQAQLPQRLSSPSSLPPAGLRDAPTAFAHHASNLNLSSVRGIKTNPCLSPSQINTFDDVNSRFASLFKQHRESLSPTFARRASNHFTAGKCRYANRARPSPPYKKKHLWKNKPGVMHSKPRPSKIPPSESSWKSTRTVRLGGPRQPSGPRGWRSNRPSSHPNAPLRDTETFPEHAARQHIFAAVPNLDFSLQRESFGMHSTVGEKLHLLSQPRSRSSNQTLAPKLHRCNMMQQVRGEMAKAQARRDKHESSASQPLMPRAQWMMDTPPYATTENADRTWRQGTRTLFGDLPPLSPSSFTGGNTLKVTARIQHPETGPVESNIALDTQSDVTTCLREYLSDVRPIRPDTVSGCGGSTNFTEEGRLQIYSDAQLQMVSVPALVASAHQLPTGCSALLGVPALMDIDIAVDQHLKLPQFSPLICHLGEKRLREWLIHHPNAKPDTSPFDLSQIKINPKLSVDQIAKVKAVIRKFAKVFEGHENSLPKPFATEPIILKLKADAKPQSIPQPRWTVAQKEIVTRWAEEGLRNGSLEPSTSAWSSRVHLVLKPPANQTAELADLKDCKLRPCGDYRLVNTQIEKIAPNLPTGLHQLEQAAGHKMYFEADSVACYNSFRLAAGVSREALAVWTPIGLMQPTVLPFGQKNSGTEAQGPYLLAAKKLRQVSNYVDDWLGYSDDFTELLQNFEAFLAVCLEFNITLNTSKTRFGFPHAQFFGFVVDESGTRLADKHLCPIRNMVPPEDISELRRVLGLFVISRKYIQNYAMITKPLTDLLRGKQPVFKWTDLQQKAYETVRDALLAGIHLAAPNFELPFHLQTDASEDGKGSLLYQLPSSPIADQFPYCKDIHAPDLMAVIAHFSKAWTDALRLRPPFYLEADALLWSTDQCKFYALSSPFPLYTYSDHLPLAWMGKSEKGPVSQFLVEHLSELDTVHQYIQGHLNSVADAASRYPLLGPKRLAPRGLANSVQEMLSRLPAYLRSAQLVHVHAGTYTSDLKVMLQAWIEGNKGNVNAVSPTKRGPPLPADLAVMIPRPEDSPTSLAYYLGSSIPFAILVPNDLLSMTFSARIYPGADTIRLKTQFHTAGKLQILATQMTWVIGNIPEYRIVEMFSQSLLTAAPITGDIITTTFEDPVPTVVEEWISEQNQDTEFLSSIGDLPGVACRQGLYLFAPDDKPPRIFVPPKTREPLVRFTHQQMFHLGPAKVAERLSKSYYWPSLSNDCRKILRDCPVCEIEKARQHQAHGLFRARPHDAPRSRYAMDFQGQGKADTGEHEALAIIDTTTRFVTVLALPDRKASTFVPAFLDAIVFQHGPPEVLHCDEAPEFMSALMSAFAEITETMMTTTKGHNARSNGIVEIFWRYWNRCMRMLSDDQYRRWPRYASQIVFAYRTAAHSSLGMLSPYELQYGTPARDTFSGILTTGTEQLQQLPTDDGDIENARLFALAVKTSTAAFIQLARNHDQYVKQETADMLNEKGFPRTFEIGALVKARFPPTKAELDITGRRSNHVSAWRGPCRIDNRLSSTSYSLTQLDTNRQYERTIINLLPWRAVSAKTPRNAQFDPATSDPFTVNEFIAVRDEPKSWFFLAKITAISVSLTEPVLIVHYYGCKDGDLKTVKFLPCWHLATQQHIVLAPNKPAHHIRYTGMVDFASLSALLVARKLNLTTTSILTSKSRRLLMPIRDELFTYE